MYEHKPENMADEKKEQVKRVAAEKKDQAERVAAENGM